MKTIVVTILLSIIYSNDNVLSRETSDKIYQKALTVIKEDELDARFNGKIEIIKRYAEMRYHIGEHIINNEMPEDIRYGLYLEATQGIINYFDEIRSESINERRMEAVKYFLLNRSVDILNTYKQDLLMTVENMITSQSLALDVCEYLLIMSELEINEDELKPLCNKFMDRLIDSVSLEQLMKHVDKIDKLDEFVILSGGIEAEWVNKLISFCRVCIEDENKEKSCLSCTLTEIMMTKVFGKDCYKVLDRLIDNETVWDLKLNNRINTERDDWIEIDYRGIELYGIHEGKRIIAKMGRLMIPEVDGLVVVIPTEHNENCSIYIPCSLIKNENECEVYLPTHMPPDMDALVFGNKRIIVFDRKPINDLNVYSNVINKNDEHNENSYAYAITAEFINNIKALDSSLKEKYSSKYLGTKYVFHPHDYLHTPYSLHEGFVGAIPIELLFNIDEASGRRCYNVRRWAKLEEVQT